MPEELAEQMPVLKELLADLGYCAMVSLEGWEADDLLGTLAAACGGPGGRLPTWPPATATACSW